jgi:hypothetical protein
MSQNMSMMMMMMMCMNPNVASNEQVQGVMAGIFQQAASNANATNNSANSTPQHPAREAHDSDDNNDAVESHIKPRNAFPEKEPRRYEDNEEDEPDHKEDINVYTGGNSDDENDGAFD